MSGRRKPGPCCRDGASSRAAGGVTTTYTYDENGNRLTALAGGVTITTTYDRLNRPLSVTISNDAGAATTYTYSLTAPSWTDPTGTYLVTLDKFDRQASLDDPVTTGTWAFAYRADGRPASATPPAGWGSATSSSYDAAGHLTGLATTNATFAYTLNRAGNRLNEAATVTGDPQNGTATFTFDPLGRLTGYALPGIRTLGASWQADTNRASLTTDGTPVATSFDAADRPTSTGFATDLDGRLTAVPSRGGAPAKTLTYDALGRLASATANGVTRTYAYDPLDRLVTISEGGNPVVRLRYVGLTGSVAQLLDGAWAVTRNIGTDWSGAALADWAAGGSGWRRLISNGHGDLVAALAANGTVSTSLRLDPWGVPLRAVPTGYPSFGFQGGWTDRTSTLVYARARWYDPVLATFTSEDAAGEIVDPPSRHLYAYGAGDPVDRADPTGTFWYRIKAGDTLARIAERYLLDANLSATIFNLNRKNPSVKTEDLIWAGGCIWVPYWKAENGHKRVVDNQCPAGRIYRKALDHSGWLYPAGHAFGFTDREVLNLRQSDLKRMTKAVIGGRGYAASQSYIRNYGVFDGFVIGLDRRYCKIHDEIRCWFGDYSLIPPGSVVERLRGSKMLVVYDHPYLPMKNRNADAQTFGRYVYVRQGVKFDLPLEAHEYIHLLQEEGGSSAFAIDYVVRLGLHGPYLRNKYERIAYLWQGWLETYPMEAPPWKIWKPVTAPKIWSPYE